MPPTKQIPDVASKELHAIMHLNLTKWLFRTEFSDAPIPIMHSVGQRVGHIVLQELIQFVPFVLAAITTNLCMQFSESGVVIPTLKHGLHTNKKHHAELASCIPYTSSQ